MTSTVQAVNGPAILAALDGVPRGDTSPTKMLQWRMKVQAVRDRVLQVNLADQRKELENEGFFALPPAKRR